jgi:hypothetical protein
MTRLLIVMALVIAHYTPARSQYARPKNCFAAMFQMSIENFTHQQFREVADLIIIHRDVNGVVWRISDLGNVWKRVSDDVPTSPNGEIVSRSGSTLAWSSVNPTSQRIAKVYTLTGNLIGTLDDIIQELQVSNFSSSVALVVIISGDQVTKHQLVLIQP